MKLVCTLMCGLFLLAGCSATQHIIDPSCAGTYEPYLTVACVPLSNISVAHYTGNINMEFGDGEPQELVAEYIQKNLTGLLKKYAHLKQVSYIDTSVKIETVVEIKPMLKKRKIQIHVPVATEPVKINDSIPDFIIVMNEPAVSTVGGGTSRVLGFKANYTLWDNHAQKIAAYGVVDAFADGLYGEITMNKWDSVVRNIASELSTVFRKLQKSK